MPIDGQDVAGGLLAHIQSVKMLWERLSRWWRGEQSGSKDNGISRNSGDDNENSSENVDDPDYQPKEITRKNTEDQSSSKINAVPVP